MLVLSILQLKRMRLPLKKDNLATSVESTIDSAIPCLGIDIHTWVWNYMNRNIHCSILCESKALERKKNVHPQGTGKINHGTPIQWSAGKALKWMRQCWVHWSRKASNMHLKIKKKKLPNTYQSSSTNVEHQRKQLVYPQFAWKEGGNAGSDSGQLSEVAT